MKLSDKHAYYNAMCDGCQAAAKQIDIDPDEYLRAKWLCGRCVAELKKMKPAIKEDTQNE